MWTGSPSHYGCRTSHILMSLFITMPRRFQVRSERTLQVICCPFPGINFLIIITVTMLISSIILLPFPTQVIQLTAKSLAWCMQLFMCPPRLYVYYSTRWVVCHFGPCPTWRAPGIENALKKRIRYYQKIKKRKKEKGWSKKKREKTNRK